MAEMGAAPAFEVQTERTPSATSVEPHGDPGLVSLAVVAAHYRIACDPGQMAHDLALGTRSATAEDVVRAARRIGLKSTLRKGQGIKRLQSVPLPAIIGIKDGTFAILTHRLADGRVRIAVHLIEARRDEYVFVEAYERPLRQVLTVQSEVARAVAKAVKLSLSSTSHTSPGVASSRKLDPLTATFGLR